MTKFSSDSDPRKETTIFLATRSMAMSPVVSSGPRLVWSANSQENLRNDILLKLADGDCIVGLNLGAVVTVRTCDVLGIVQCSRVDVVIWAVSSCSVLLVKAEIAKYVCANICET